jgi:hypothetical protein
VILRISIYARALLMLSLFFLASCAPNIVTLPEPRPLSPEASVGLLPGKVVVSSATTTSTLTFQTNDSQILFVGDQLVGINTPQQWTVQLGSAIQSYAKVYLSPLVVAGDDFELLVSLHHSEMPGASAECDIEVIVIKNGQVVNQRTYRGHAQQNRLIAFFMNSDAEAQSLLTTALESAFQQAHDDISKQAQSWIHPVSASAQSSTDTKAGQLGPVQERGLSDHQDDIPQPGTVRVGQDGNERTTTVANQAEESSRDAAGNLVNKPEPLLPGRACSVDQILAMKNAGLRDEQVKRACGTRP